MEHYCTLFDLGFLPQGLALHDSLCQHAEPFTLWVLSLDQATQVALETLALPGVRVLALSDCETTELRAARANRTYGEYCWALGSQLFSFVFDRDRTVGRLTYLDADVFFFASPAPFFTELEQSGKSVLITEHAFAPTYAHYSETLGRYCVQFVTFTNEPASIDLLTRWQRQTLESSGAKGAMFGDQQYLDAWPEEFGQLVHVLDHRDRTLAPWNADYIAGSSAEWRPVLYHFHSYRRGGSRLTQWCHGYPLRHQRVRALYLSYQAVVEESLARLRSAGITTRAQGLQWRGVAGLRLLRSLLLGRLVLHLHSPRFAKADD